MEFQPILTGSSQPSYDTALLTFESVTVHVPALGTLPVSASSAEIEEPLIVVGTDQVAEPDVSVGVV
jgi:hypothetical protein